MLDTLFGALICIAGFASAFIATILIGSWAAWAARSPHNERY